MSAQCPHCLSPLVAMTDHTGTYLVHTDMWLTRCTGVPRWRVPATAVLTTPEPADSRQEVNAGPGLPNPQQTSGETTMVNTPDTPGIGVQHAPTVYPVELISFGYLHGDAPDADLVMDVRDIMRDPAAARDILDLDGRDQRVSAVVLATRNASSVMSQAFDAVERMPSDRALRIAIGCAGGRHRSVALVEAIAAVLRDFMIPVTVDHRDVHRPRVLHPAGEQR